MDALASEVIDLLRRLVEIHSVNPSLVPGAAGETEIAAEIVRWAEHAGLRVEVVPTADGRPSVVVRGGRGGDGRRLLLCGHLDTVGHTGMADPLVPTVVGDRLFGRGAYDMKAGLAAALVVCWEAERSGLAGEVIVAAVADEEHSSTGVQAVLAHAGLLEGVDAAIVTEPTELTVATAHKGFVWVEIEVTGKAAHGSRPQLGVDAILKTGPVLVALSDLDRALRGVMHPTLGPGNLHASLITGGSEESTVPDRCVLTVERRTLPGESVTDVETEIAAVLAASRSDDSELVASARTLLAREPFETTADEPFVATVVAAVSHVLGRPVEAGAMSYWADSAFIAAAGIPTVLFGPDGEGAHAEVEWVSIPGTVACTRALIETARRFCG
jgi:acetylornithine deacetylase